MLPQTPVTMTPGYRTSPEPKETMEVAKPNEKTFITFFK